MKQKKRYRDPKFRDYYQSKHWRTTSASYLNDKECVCEICGLRRWELYVRGPKKGQYKKPEKFSVHHKHYKTLGEETKDDLVVCCNPCHEAGHHLHKMQSHGSPWKELYLQLQSKTNWNY